MKTSSIYLLTLGLLLTATLATGCRKGLADGDNGASANGMTQVGFQSGALMIAQVGNSNGWESSVPHSKADPETGPEVTTPDRLPVGTTFRLVVYNAGDDPKTAEPVAQNTYKVADAEGKVLATLVDEFGTALEGTDTSAIILRRGDYDFYYFSPAIPIGKTRTATYSDLGQDIDYMALYQRQSVDPSKGRLHGVTEVNFYRMASYIDIKIAPREGEIIGTLEVDPNNGLEVFGFTNTGYYEIGGYPYYLATEGTGGMVAYSATDFGAVPDHTATISTEEVDGGHIVLPGVASDLRISGVVLSDGATKRFSTSLGTQIFEPGYRYLIELGISRVAEDPTVNITVLPWNEVDWDDTDIGGGIPSLSDPMMANSAMITPNCGESGAAKFHIGKLTYGWQKTVPAHGTMHAEVLWQDGNVINNNNIKLVGRYLYVWSSKATEGNAVIALYNQQNEILWSWHVWVTSYKPDGLKSYGLSANSKADVTGGQVHTYGTNYMSVYPSQVMMDRALGALATYNTTAPAAGDQNAPKAHGLLYQWGRKDPLPAGDFNTQASRIIYKGDGTTTTQMNTVEVSTILDGAPNALEYSIKHPLTDIYGSVLGDWYTDNAGNQNNTLWTENSEKSAYDPCPYGWRIPTINTWGDFTTSMLQNPYDISFGIQYTLGNTGAIAWYAGTPFYYASSGLISAEGNNASYQSSSLEGTNSYRLAGSSTGGYVVVATGRASAINVRCVQNVTARGVDTGGEEYGITSAKISPDPTAGYIDVRGDEFTVTLTSSVMWTAPVNIRAWDIENEEVVATGTVSYNASQRGGSGTITIGQNTKETLRRMYFQYQWDNQWYDIPQLAQQQGSLIDVGGTILLENPVPSQSVTWQEAADYCKNKESSTSEKWRLPTANELHFFWCITPSLSGDQLFPADSYFWSSTKVDSRPVSFHSTAGDVNSYSLAGKKNDPTWLYRVRCVKAAPRDLTTSYPKINQSTDGQGDYIVTLQENGLGLPTSTLHAQRLSTSATGDETSADNRMSRKFRIQNSYPTGITIAGSQITESSVLLWANAIEYCKALNNINYHGFNNWRVPTQRELHLLFPIGVSQDVVVGAKDFTENSSGTLIDTRLVQEYLYTYPSFLKYTQSNGTGDAYGAGGFWSSTGISEFTINTGSWNTNRSWVQITNGGRAGDSGHWSRTNAKINVRCIRDEEW